MEDKKVEEWKEKNCSFCGGQYYECSDSEGNLIDEQVKICIDTNKENETK